MLRSRRELLAGRPDRAVRPVLRALPRPRARRSAAPTTCPGGDNERFLEYWNLVFMQYDQNPDDVLTPLPAQNIDTGLGLNRMAAILQDVPSVFETDQFAPLIALGEELSGRSHGEDFPTDAGAAHPRRPHARGDVPDRRRRRALQRGPRLRAAARDAPRDPAGPPARASSPGFLPRYAEVRARADGPRLPGAARAARGDPTLAGRRGGGLRPHARAGHAAARRRSSRGRASRATRASAPRRRSGCTTRSASRST